MIKSEAVTISKGGSSVGSVNAQVSPSAGVGTKDRDVAATDDRSPSPAGPFATGGNRTVPRTESQQQSACHDATQQRLECLRQEFQEFVQIVSHDLKTPLRAINGFAGFLQEEYQQQLDDTATAYVSRILEGSVRMAKLIKGLDEFAHVAVHPQGFEAVDLDEVLVDVLVALKDLIEDENAVVVRQSLPSVLGDRRQLGVLLTNLVSNGIVFNETGAPVIKVHAEYDHSGWKILVSDNGIGIAQEQRESVFKMFRQLNTCEYHDGVGAGLAICRRIVKRHSGQIWVESSGDRGTTICVFLPSERSS